MTKKYAIVCPAYANSLDGFANLPTLFITPFHKLKYEQICGYSLGHSVKFFDTLDNAKRHFLPPPGDERADFLQSQNAIVELNIENNQISSFGKIYEIDYKLARVVLKPDFSPEVWKWNEKNIKPTDVSQGALNEINKQFHAVEDSRYTRQP